MVTIKKIDLLPRQVDMELVSPVLLWRTVISPTGDIAGLGMRGDELCVIPPPFRIVARFPLPRRYFHLFWVHGTSILAAVSDSMVKLVRVLPNNIECRDLPLVFLPPIDENTLTVSASGEDYGLPFGLRLRTNVPQNVRYLTDTVVVHLGESDSSTWIRFVNQDFPVVAFASDVAHINASVSGRVVKVDDIIIKDFRHWYELPEGGCGLDQPVFPDIGLAYKSSSVIWVSFKEEVVGYRMDVESLGVNDVGLLPDGHLVFISKRGILVSRSPVV